MRSERARQFEVAPRARIFNAIFALDESGGADPGVEITALFPTLEQVDGAPSVDLIVTFAIQDVASGPEVIVGLAEAAAQASYKHFNVAAGVATIRVRKLRPRLNAAATALLDGQRVFILNTDAVNSYADVAITIEVPSLNWD